MKKINDLFFMRPWAIAEDGLKVIKEVLQRHSDGIKLTSEEIEAAIGGAQKEKAALEIQNGVAIIPVQGIISKRASLVNRISMGGGTSTQEIKKNIQAALADKSVHTIALDVDSPGGSVDGVPELADFIYEARKKKKIYAYADGQMASAAYWIGSAAEKVFATKASEVGSIGVYSVVQDWTVANHNMGLKTEVIKAGKHKASGHPDRPFTEEDRAVIQESVNAYYKLFTEAVMHHRAMSDEDVIAAATGKVFIGDKALDMGLIDGIESIESLIEAGAPAARPSAENKTSISTQQEEETMDLKSLTLDELKIARPDLCVALVNEGKAAGSAEAKAAADADARTAAGAEKDRVVAIMEKAKAIGAVEDSAIACVKDGLSFEAAHDKMKAAKLDKITAASPAPLGAGNSGNPLPAGQPNFEGLSFDEEIQKRWETNADDCKKQFSSIETFKSYTKAKRRGQVSEKRPALK